MHPVIKLLLLFLSLSFARSQTISSSYYESWINSLTNLEFVGQSSINVDDALPTFSDKLRFAYRFRLTGLASAGDMYGSPQNGNLNYFWKGSDFNRVAQHSFETSADYDDLDLNDTDYENASETVIFVCQYFGIRQFDPSPKKMVILV